MEQVRKSEKTKSNHFMVVMSHSSSEPDHVKIKQGENSHEIENETAIARTFAIIRRKLSQFRTRIGN